MQLTLITAIFTALAVSARANPIELPTARKSLLVVIDLIQFLIIINLIPYNPCSMPYRRGGSSCTLLTVGMAFFFPKN